jgi:hypothetical protein
MLARHLAGRKRPTNRKLLLTEGTSGVIVVTLRAQVLRCRGFDGVAFRAQMSPDESEVRADFGLRRMSALAAPDVRNSSK